MKRFFLACFYIIISFVISAAGFLLPSALNGYQDDQIFSTIEHAAIEPMEFTYSSSLLDTLRLISSGYFLVEYPVTASSRSSDDVYQLALNLVEQLKKYGLVIFDESDTIVNHDAALQLAIASNNTNAQTEAASAVSRDEKQNPKGTAADQSDSKSSRSNSPEITTAVIWRCSLYSQNGHWINFKIDDKSGKPVDLSIFSEQTAQASFSTAQIEALVTAISAFLEDNYELPADPILQKMNQTSPGFFDNQTSFNEIIYTIQFKEESGSLIQIPLRIRGDYLVMNNLYE